MKRMLFFVNPNAGQVAAGFELLPIIQEFAQGGYRVEVYPTQRPRDLTDTVAREGWKYDMIVVTGGDGTLNEATSGLMQLPEEKRPLLGYIPRGTVNDVSRTLGLSRVPKIAAQDIISGLTFPMDVGSFNDSWFNYVAAFGAFTGVAYRTSSEDKKVLGRLAYLLDGVKSLTEIRPIRVRMKANGKTVEEEVLLGLVTSTTSVGGFRIRGEQNTDLGDGLFEILLVRHIDSLVALKDVAAALARGDFSGDLFYSCKASHAEFYFDTPVDWTLDGEHGGCTDRAFIDNYRRAQKIRIPGEKKQKHTGLLHLPGK